MVAKLFKVELFIIGLTPQHAQEEYMLARKHLDLERSLSLIKTAQVLQRCH